MRVLLTEGAASAVMIYLIVKRMALSFKDWPAYKLGIIDEKGKKLKDAKTSEERAAWTLFDRFIWNIRKILTKFVGQSRMAAMLTTAFLLKDSITPLLKHDSFLAEVNDDIDGMTCQQQEEIFYMIKALDESLVLVEGEGAELGLYRHAAKVAKLYSDEEIKRIFGL